MANETLIARPTVTQGVFIHHKVPLGVFKEAVDQHVLSSQTLGFKHGKQPHAEALKSKDGSVFVIITDNEGVILGAAHIIKEVLNA